MVFLAVVWAVVVCGSVAMVSVRVGVGVGVVVGGVVGGVCVV